MFRRVSVKVDPEENDADDSNANERFVCCHHCGQLFDSKHKLETHVKLVHGASVFGVKEWYGCGVCLTSLTSSKQEIVSHLTSLHNDVNVDNVCVDDYRVRSVEQAKIPCEVCGVRSLWWNVCAVHKSVWKSSSSLCTRVCLFCDESFFDGRMYQAHVNIVHGAQLHRKDKFQCYKCNVCNDQLFLGREQLNFHLNVALNVAHVSKQDIDLAECTVTAVKDILSACKCCRAPCVYSKFCTKHDALIKIDNCSDHVEYHSCQVCREKFNDCKSLWAHAFGEHLDGAAVTQQQPLKCNLCLESVAPVIRSPSLLMHHWKETHRYTVVDLLNDVSLREKATVVVNGQTKFECPDCRTVMKKFQSLKEHVREIHSLDWFACEFCYRTFSLNKRLVQHYRNKHGIHGLYADVSDKTLRASAKCRSGGTSDGVWFKCLGCEVVVRNLRELKEHMAYVHTCLKQYLCDTCGVALGTKKLLLEHCTRKHASGLTIDTSEGLPFNDAEEAFTAGDVTLDEEGLETVVNEDGKLKYKCPHCEKSYFSVLDLKDHLRFVKNKKKNKFACHLCEKSFTFKHSLSEHYKLVHSLNLTGPRKVNEERVQCQVKVGDVTKFACPHCSAKYVRYQTLKIHMRRHTGEKPFSCDTCDRSFAAQTFLKAHVKRSHLGIRYECKICGRRMTDNANLRGHMRIHTGDKKYVCDVCGKGFPHWTSYYYHKYTHNEELIFQCTECDEKFSHPKAFSEHKRKHRNVSSKLVCEICGHEFSKRPNLINHLMTHSTERPHVCEFCSAGFKLRKHLVQHYRTHKEK